MRITLKVLILGLVYVNSAWASHPVVCQVEMIQLVLKHHENNLDSQKASKIFDVSILENIRFDQNGQKLVFEGTDLQKKRNCKATYTLKKLGGVQAIGGCPQYKVLKEVSNCTVKRVGYK